MRFCRPTPFEADQRHRITQIKMPITTTKLSKNDLERPYQASAPPDSSRRLAKASRHNRQGPNSFCLGTRKIAYLQSNPASGYLGLRFFTARLTSNPSHQRSPSRLPNLATRRSYYHLPLSRSTGSIVNSKIHSLHPSAACDYTGLRQVIKWRFFFYARSRIWFSTGSGFLPFFAGLLSAAVGPAWCSARSRIARTEAKRGARFPPNW